MADFVDRLHFIERRRNVARATTVPFLLMLTVGFVISMSGPLHADEPKAGGSATLESRLMPLIRAHKGKVAVAVKHLGTGESFDYQPRTVMPTASLIKFPVMIEAYRQAAAKKIDLDSVVVLKKQDKVPGSGVLTYHFTDGATFKLRDAVRLMIAFSDNTATNLVLDAIGIGATAATMEKMGYPNTKIHSKVFRRDTSVFPERSKQFGLGSTTADEMIRLCEAVDRELIVSPPACDEMLEHLRACEDKDKFPRLLPPGDQGRVQDRQPRRDPHRGRDHRVARRARRGLRPLLRERRQALGSRQRRQPALRRDRPGGLRPFRSGPSPGIRNEPAADREPDSDYSQDLRQGLRLALAVDARQRRVAFGKQHAVTQDLVLVHDLDMGDPRYRGAHGQHVVVISGPLEFAADVDDHQEMSRVFDLAIGDPAVAEHLRPGHLEVDEVIRVVQEAHAVRLGIAHADRDLVAVDHE